MAPLPRPLEASEVPRIQTSIARGGTLVPERETMRRDVLGSLHSQFWSQQIASTSSQDGLAICSPGQAPAPSLLGRSGVSRPQFIVAAQAASLPCLPAYSQSEGGLVLDRVLLAQGGESWWATLSARAKAQRILRGGRQRLVASLSDASSYSYCATASLRPLKGTTLRAKMEYAPLGSTPPLPASAASPAQPSSSSNGAPESRPQSARSPHSLPAVLAFKGVGARPAGAAEQWLSDVLGGQQRLSGAAQLRRNLRGSELRADVAVNQVMVDGVGRPYTVPLSCTADVCTPSHHLPLFQYRVGVQHVLAPLTARGNEGSEGAAHSSTHMQAALAMQGQRTLWVGNPAARKASNARAARSVNSTKGGKSRANFQVGAAPSPSASAQEGPGAPARSKALGPHNPIRQVLHRLLQPPIPPTVGGAEGGAEGGAGRKGESRRQALEVGGVKVALPHAEEVQESLLDAVQSINRLREDVQSLASWVGSGGFSSELAQLSGTPAPSSSAKGASGASGTVPGAGRGGNGAGRGAAGEGMLGAHRPWSSVVGPPHVKLAGLLGVSARHPLGLWRASGPGGPRMSSGGGAVTAARAATLSSDLVRAGVEWVAAALADPHARLAPRAYASLGASAQLGWAQRPLLDFTRATVRADLGLPGKPQAQGLRLHPAFSLDQRGVWHAVSLSLCQQLVGPVRACADLRYSLEGSAPGPRFARALPSAPPPPFASPAIGKSSRTSGVAADLKARLGAASTLLSRAGTGVAGHVGGLRPRLMDSVYGLDLVLPGAAGLVRLVAWYSPLRGEAQLELRLL